MLYPRTPPSPEQNVLGEVRLGRVHDPLREDVLVADEDLRQTWLQARVVADHGNVCEATSEFLSRHVLHDLCLLGAAESSLPGYSKPSFLIVVQPAASLVQVNAEKRFVSTLSFGEIPPLPRSARLRV